MRTRRERSSRKFIVLRRSQLMLILFCVVVIFLLFWLGRQMLWPQAMPTSGFHLQAGKIVPPEISARAAILIDGQSGRVLYERRASDKLAVASLTKMMTVALALQIGDPQELVTISESVLQVEPVLIGLRPGEHLALGDLETAALVHSGNDAALMLAEHLAGDELTFAQWMTEQAHAIGCRDTVFFNAHGLDQAGHLSTAADQAKIARYALSIPRFAHLASTLTYDLPGDRTAWNLNHLLEEMPGADGIKIGFTDLAGRCLAASATRDSVQLIAVVLNAPDWFEDAQKLLEYGFELSMDIAVPAGTELQRVFVNNKQYALCAAKDLRLPLSVGEWFDLQPVCTVDELEQAAQSKAAVWGELRAFGLEDFTIPLWIR